MAIDISNEVKQRLVESVKRYFAEEMDEEIGDLKASLLLDFCLKEVAPTVYNLAISDAQVYFHDKVADVEGSCYEPEFRYWKK